ncbi:MAG: AAA family ATPase [Bacteroidota bacterium]|nr:AAA family ATPase [Bacteroidota bacterium]
MEQLVRIHQNLLNNLNATFTRHLIRDIAWGEKLIGIKGSRGVGKTTLILQKIKSDYGINKEYLYVSLDNIVFPYKNILELAEDFYIRGGKCLFLDEIHKFNNWAIELKNIYDSLPGLKVVFTGSSILHLHSGKSDLSRRAVIYNMQGLSFREFIEIETGLLFDFYTLEEIIRNHEKIAFEICSKIKPLSLFENYLKYGYYPYYLQNKETYFYKLANTLNVILETDIPYVMNMDIRHINKLKKFLYVLATNVPFSPNISKLSSSMEMSRPTVITYLNYLKEAEIINFIYHRGKGYSKIARPEKVYLNHPNISYCISGEMTDIGNIRESFFLNQVSSLHNIEVPDRGDFMIDDKYIIEVGGRSKSNYQISGLTNSYIASDDIENGFENKIPLWLFGFLY